jgi:single-strand DNA-binding protein
MFNKAIIIGRLTADPEVKVTPNKGASVCSFTVAVDRPFKAEGGERFTDFVNVVSWRSTAEFVGKWFGKGDMVGVEGTLQSRSYTNKDGEKRTIWEVVADRAFFAGNRVNNATQNENATQAEFAPEEPIGDNSDLPF